MYFDSHCHLDFERFDADRDELLATAREQGVTRWFVPGVAPSAWQRQAERVASIPGVCLGFGIHPFWAAEVEPDSLDSVLPELERILVAQAACAIGECGLDALWARRHDVTLEHQTVLLERQLELAKRLELPVVLHCVRAHGRLLSALERLGPLPAGGALHAYSGSAELVPRYERLGFYFGFGGGVTQPGARRARAALSQVAPERLLIETDAPDQTPPWATGRNEPAQLASIAARIAALTGISPRALAEVTRRNAERLFRLGA